VERLARVVVRHGRSVRPNQGSGGEPETPTFVIVCGTVARRPLFTVTDPLTGKHRRTTYRLTLEEARPLNIPSS
jgi:hypothetical protein